MVVALLFGQSVHTRSLASVHSSPGLTYCSLVQDLHGAHLSLSALLYVPTVHCLHCCKPFARFATTESSAHVVQVVSATLVHSTVIAWPTAQFLQRKHEVAPGGL
jgi:hypothetical protein